MADVDGVEWDGMKLKEEWWPGAKVRDGWWRSEGGDRRRGFYDCSKAERLLGWVHSESGE